MKTMDFRMTIGDDKSLVVDVTDANGDTVAITSATIAWKAAKNFDATAVISKSTSSGISITSGSGGIFTITLDDTDTADLTPGDYMHEAQVTFSNGKVATVLRGVMTLERGLV